MGDDAAVSRQRTATASVSGVSGWSRGATSVSLTCAACRALAIVSPEARAFRCRSCGANNTFFECAHCHTASIGATPHGQPASRWECDACHQSTSVPLFGRMPVQTARDVMASLELRGLDSTGRRQVRLGGFVAVASSRPTIPLGSSCTVSMLDDGIGVRVADGSSGEVFAYDALDVLEVSGRGQGDQGGPARSNLLSVQRPEVDTVLRIVVGDDVVVLRHPKHTREQLRRAFAEMFVRREAARQPVAAVRGLSFDEAVGELERLTRLHTSGGISDAEFEAMRAPIVRRLSVRVV